VQSLAGQLDPGAWQNLTSQGMGNWIPTNPSATLLGELRTAGMLTISPGAQISLGRVFAPDAPAAFGQSTPEDLQFQFTSTGQTIDATVKYTGVARNSTLTLVVDPVTGRTLLRNDTPFDPAIEGYVINSAAGSLRPGSGFWNSLDDQGANSGGWIEANPSANQVAELSSTGAVPLTHTTVLDLGMLFDPTHTQDLVLQFLLAGQAAPMFGNVVYEFVGLAGDYNDDGTVDAADYVVWRSTQGGTVARGDGADGNFDGQVNQQDLAVWRANFGKVYPTQAAGLAAVVPEPGTLILVAWAVVAYIHTARTRGDH
jgi:hypothetical protein